MKKYGKMLGGAAAGAIAGVVLWFILNGMWVVNGQGMLERAGGLAASPWNFGLAGALVGIVASLIDVRRTADQERELAELGERLALNFAPAVELTELAEYRGLSIVRKAARAWNRLSGEIGGTPFDTVELKYVEKGNESDISYQQTVALVETEGARLPTFTMCPRGAGLRLLRLMGIEGIEMNSGSSRELDPQGAKQFDRSYFVMGRDLCGTADLVDSRGKELDASGTEAEIRRLFSPRLLRFFSERPGWQVESAEGGLAIWRPKRTIKPADRPQFIADALSIRSALVSAAEDAGQGGATVAASAGDRESPVARAQARMIGAVLGAFVGFFAGGIGGGIIAGNMFFNAANGANMGAGDFFAQVAPIFVVFFGGAFGGLVLGAVAGARLLGPMLEGLLRRRGEQSRARKGTGPCDQPASSAAQVEERGSALMITLPPPGLVRGCGFFLFLWCVIWNGILCVMTPIMIGSALRGDLKNDVGQPMHIGWAVLFLTPFWGAGIGVGTAILYRGWRRSEIELNEEELRVATTTIFGRREQSWRRKQIEDVRYSTTESATANMAVALHGLPEVRLFGYRDKVEVAWLVRLLRDRLGLEQIKE